MPKLIAPTPYNTTAIQQAIDLGLLAAGAVAKAEFLLFTASWSTENTPIWSEEGPKTSRGDRVWRYTTDSTPMVWVDDGTPEHPITAVNFDRLRFQREFMPKTRPGVITSTAGGKFGEWAAPFAVTHPGAEARNISITIGEKSDVAKFISSQMSKHV